MQLQSRIFGWSPPDNEDYVNVRIDTSQLRPLQNPTFHISDLGVLRRPHSQRAMLGNLEPASPASSSSALSTDDSPSEQRIENTGNHDDSSWVARPRNEFILFRCDYVQRHSREGRRVRRPPGAEVEKTLSKQAAEAWHHLPPEERLYWKDRANGERNEHARRYPDYRYRPKKNLSSRRRASRPSPDKPPTTPEKSSKADEPSTSNSDQSLLSSISIVPPKDFRISEKATPRRAASVPELNATVSQVNRRLRSTASQGWIMTPLSPPTDKISFSQSEEYGPIPRLLDASASNLEQPTFTTPDYSSSLAIQPTETVVRSTSSSLINWNGENGPQQLLSPKFDPLSSIVGLETTDNFHLQGFTTGGHPIAPSELFAMDEQYYSNGDIWAPLLAPYSGSCNAVTVAKNSEANGMGGALEPPTAPKNRTSDAFHDLSDYADIPHLGPYSSMDMLGATQMSSSEIMFTMETDEFFSLHF